MQIFDAEDRAALQVAALYVIRASLILLGSVIFVLLFAVVAGMAVWLFRISSGL